LIQTLPSSITQNLTYAKNALRRGEGLAAIVHLKQALAVDPENAEAFELLGIAHEHEGDRTAALKALATSTEIDPRSASGHYNYGLVLSEAGKLDEALEEVQAALIIRSDYAAARDLHSALARRLKDRFCRSDEGFAVLSSKVDPLANPSEDWAKLKCESCGGMNFITARTCARCGSYLPEIAEIVPVE
jgi:tetratricopeptide (TPR) repeat protein